MFWLLLNKITTYFMLLINETNIILCIVYDNYLIARYDFV